MVPEQQGSLEEQTENFRSVFLCRVAEVWFTWTMKGPFRPKSLVGPLLCLTLSDPKRLTPQVPEPTPYCLELVPTPCRAFMCARVVYGLLKAESVEKHSDVPRLPTVVDYVYLTESFSLTVENYWDKVPEQLYRRLVGRSHTLL